MSNRLEWIGKMPDEEPMVEYTARLHSGTENTHIDVVVRAPLSDPIDVLIYDSVVYRHIGFDPPRTTYLEASAAYVWPEPA
ncbi:hypothetical protein EON82_14590 [bacterium]|nr:MAG: hypothetical protein EON82_14590 [bacterium]